MNLTESMVARFWQHANPEPNTGCWLWAGSANSQGYGYISTREGGRSKNYMAHRVAVVLSGREIPDGLVVDHLCRVPGCVNPDHLDVVDNRTNVLRGLSPVAVARRNGLCKRGHRLIDGNVWRDKRGLATCRTCKRDLKRERRKSDVHRAHLNQRNVEWRARKRAAKEAA